MNKKGFLSTSMVYSFFLVFLLLLLFIVADLINNRTLVSKISNEIKDSIYNSSLSGYLINEADSLGLVYHNNNLENSLNDNSYRYVGLDPNNYVCLGDNCSDVNNLYRIIGIIDGKVKLIKNTASANMAIDSFNSDFNYTSLVNYLNTPNEDSYYTSISSYVNLIATTSWHVGGISELSTNSVDVYNAEMASSTILRQIGLMYISDYLYASDNNGDNWLNDGTNNWVITKYNPEIVDNSKDTEIIDEYYYIDSLGTISRANITATNNIRPVFYLKNSVKMTGGKGTLQEPYLIGGNNA